jgi:hypothetical protein
MGKINWTEDAWFEREHAPHLTQDFKDWWVGFYGPPTDCLTLDDTDEYWVRCAFAWMGWEAARREHA